jgi:hypothetical protein
MSNYSNITATTQVKVGAGKLKGIFCASVSGTPAVVVYDEAQGGTTKVILASFVPVVGTQYNFSDGIFFSSGLNVAITTSNITVIYE